MYVSMYSEAFLRPRLWGAELSVVVPRWVLSLSPSIDGSLYSLGACHVREAGGGKRQGFRSEAFRLGRVESALPQLTAVVPYCNVSLGMHASRV